MYLKQRSHSLKEYEYYFSQFNTKKTLKETIKKVIEKKGFCKIMDVGCGNCEALSELKKIFSDKITTIGIDLIEPKEKIDLFIKGDAIENAFPINIDLMLCFRSAHEIGRIQKLVEKTMAALSVKGKAFFFVRTIKNVNGKLEFEENIKEEDMEYLLKKARQNQKIFVETVYQETETPKGKAKFITGFKIIIEE